MSKRDTGKPSRTDWARVDAMTDEDIDYSDIPASSDEELRRARLRIPENHGTVTRVLERYRAPRRGRETALSERERQDSQELAELNPAYADAPTQEERETQRRMWDLQKRQMAREPW
jgi:hypothetical protein